MSYSIAQIIDDLRAAREDTGMSQRALSARSGLTQSHISQIERGSLEPGLSSLIDMARALDLELVLVPRKMFPAVSAVLRTEEKRRELTPERAVLALREIEKGERLIRKQQVLYGPSENLRRLADTLDALRRLPLRPTDISTIRDALSELRRHQASPQSQDLIEEIAVRLLDLRNRRAHGEAEAPRPAYSLDEDDDA